jgi:molecular chaperone DnaJ
VATRPRRDYYAVLGVARNADRDTIRRAFRLLASELHPDVSDDPMAVDRFREVTEAYEVLSRPATRARYDRYGFDARGVGGFTSGWGSASSLFDDLFGAASFQQPARPGSDIHVEISVDYEDAIRGASRAVRYRARATCVACGGSGGAPGSARNVCGECGGRGRLREHGGAGARGAFHLRSCAACSGTGRRFATSCRECDGEGRPELERALLLDIPPGTESGTEIRVEGEGDPGAGGGEPGDVVVTVVVRPPQDAPLFRRLAAAGAICGIGLLVLVVVYVFFD